jgi:hypothetical protein
MVKKVALVDIDGCLIESRKLNYALVEQLKSYDEVILFTQRSIYLQSGQIPRAYLLDNPPGHDDIVNTPDLVNALNAILPRPVKVSTSVDHIFGRPTQYYEMTLRSFEEDLKDHAQHARNDEEYKQPFDLQEKYSSEIETVRNHFKKPEHENPSNFYPQGKIEQCQALLIELPALLENEDSFEIDFFDDNIDNLTEVMNAKDNQLSHKPRCILVSSAYICPVEQFRAKYSNDFDSRNRTNKQLLQNDPIAKLAQYIVSRETERQQSKSEFGSGWAQLFTPNRGNATTKINAARQGIRILQGEKDVHLTSDELAALKHRRLKSNIGDSINIIIESQKSQKSPQHTG